MGNNILFGFHLLHYQLLLVFNWSSIICYLALSWCRLFFARTNLFCRILNCSNSSSKFRNSIRWCWSLWYVSFRFRIITLENNIMQWYLNLFLFISYIMTLEFLSSIFNSISDWSTFSSKIILLLNSFLIFLSCWFFLSLFCWRLSCWRRSLSCWRRTLLDDAWGSNSGRLPGTWWLLQAFWCNFLGSLGMVD